MTVRSMLADISELSGLLRLRAQVTYTQLCPDLPRSTVHRRMSPVTPSVIEAPARGKPARAHGKVSKPSLMRVQAL